MSRDADAEYVRDTLGDLYGVTLRRIPESKKEEGKSADLELLVSDQRTAVLDVLEVKTIEETPRTEENGFRKDGIWTVRTDNSPKRVGTLIHKAWKQLSTYPEELPRVLVLVNDEGGADVQDLEEAFQGFLDYGGDEGATMRNVASRKIAAGRIRDEKWRIDLYIWIDRHYGTGTTVQVFPTGGTPKLERRTLGPYFRCTSERGNELMRAHFHAEGATTPTEVRGVGL